MTDEQCILSLGFEENPLCPVRVVRPSQEKRWLEEEQGRKRRHRPQCKLDEIDRVAKEWTDYERAKIDLEVLNRCLTEMIREKFKTAYGQEPQCDLSPFLYREEKLFPELALCSVGGKQKYCYPWRWNGREWVTLSNKVR